MILDMWLKKWRAHRGGHCMCAGMSVWFKGAASAMSGRSQGEGRAVRRTLG